MHARVLIADPLSEEGIEPLYNTDDVKVDIKTSLSKEELLNSIDQYDALLVRSQTQVTKEVIAKGKRLRVIGRAGVGVDNIDIEAATEHGVVVVNAPNGNMNAAAEHTLAMIMSLARNIPQAFHALKNHVWDRSTYMGVELKNKTLGIIGLGRIGAEVAYRAKGQRMNVIAYDPFLTDKRAETMGIQNGEFTEVVKQADFLTVHTPLMDATRNIINEEAFKLMKPSAYIINCARGGIIHEEALYNALKENKIAGAAIDVFVEEPAIDHPILTLPNVIATPHLGASTIEAQENVAIDVSEDVVRILSGNLVRNPVNIPSVPEESMKEVAPYMNLALKTGEFLARIQTEAIEEMHIRYAGEVANIDVAPLTRNIIKGYLRPHLGARVNDVNAAYVAEKKGIAIHEHKTNAAKGFTNAITVEIRMSNEVRTATGTLLNGLGARIVNIDGYPVDVVPEGHLVMVHHKDQPGAIGKVGTLFADEGINIASMHVGRKQIGGEAIMMLTIDHELHEGALEKAKQLDHIYHVTPINL